MTGTETDVTPNVEALNSKDDQPKNRILYWARGGDIKFFERGLRQAAVTRNFQQTWQQWQYQNVLSMGMAYWWTGVPSYRSTVLLMAQGSMNSWFASPSNPGYDEGRITGRNIGWALQAWLLGYGSSSLGGYTPVQWMDGLAQLQLTRQDANGAWTEYGTGHAGPGPELPVELHGGAAGILSVALYGVPGPEPGGRGEGGDPAQRRLPDDAVRPTYKTWHYWSDWTKGDPQVTLADMRGLALLQTMAYYRAYHDGAGAGYLTQADAALAQFAANTRARSAPKSAASPTR